MGDHDTVIAATLPVAEVDIEVEVAAHLLHAALDIALQTALDTGSDLGKINSEVAKIGARLFEEIYQLEFSGAVLDDNLGAALFDFEYAFVVDRGNDDVVLAGKRRQEVGHQGPGLVGGGVEANLLEADDRTSYRFIVFQAKLPSFVSCYTPFIRLNCNIESWSPIHMEVNSPHFQLDDKQSPADQAKLHVPLSDETPMLNEAYLVAESNSMFQQEQEEEQEQHRQQRPD